MDSCCSLHSPLMSAVALKISSTGTLNHFTMLRFTSPKANKNRHVAGIKVSRINETNNFVLNFEPGFCCLRSAQTLIKVRRSTKPKMSRIRKMNVESVYKRTIWVGSDGLRKGSRLKAACTKTNKANVSRKNPAITETLGEKPSRLIWGSKTKKLVPEATILKSSEPLPATKP